MIFHSAPKYDLEQLIWERVWWGKQAALWKNALSEDSTVYCNERTCCSVCSARWRYSRPAVAGEFSLARELEAQRHHTAPASRCATSTTLCFTPSDDERAALLVTLWIFMGLWFLWQRNREPKSDLFSQGCHVCSVISGQMSEKNRIFLSLSPLMFSVGDLPWQFWSSMASSYISLCNYQRKA